MSRFLMIASGVIFILGGLAALLAPIVASLAAALIAGWTFVIAGVLHLVAAFQTSEDRGWNILFGALGILLGLSFVFNPLGGMISLTLLLGGLFLASGVVQLWYAWKQRETKSVVWMALSGLVSVALGLLILFNLGIAAATVPGIILAIELASTGIALILLRDKVGTMTDGPQSPAA